VEAARPCPTTEEGFALKHCGAVPHRLRRPRHEFVLACILRWCSRLRRPSGPPLSAVCLEGSPAPPPASRRDTVVEVNGGPSRTGRLGARSRTPTGAGHRAHQARQCRETVTVTARKTMTIHIPASAERYGLARTAAHSSDQLGLATRRRSGRPPGGRSRAAVRGSPCTRPRPRGGIRTRRQPFPITVERGGKTLTLTVTPRAVPRSRGHGPETRRQDRRRHRDESVRFEPTPVDASSTHGAHVGRDRLRSRALEARLAADRLVEHRRPIQIGPSGGGARPERAGALAIFTAFIA